MELPTNGKKHTKNNENNKIGNDQTEVATCRDNVMSSTFLTLQETSMSQSATGNNVAEIDMTRYRNMIWEIENSSELLLSRQQDE